MKDLPMQVGRVVRSKAGRDKGRFFVVSELCNDSQHVMIINGRLRKFANPKKKKIKHLASQPAVATELAQRLCSGQTVLDSEIRRFLSAMNAGAKKEG
ncbi:MAG: hypothetical protein ACYCX2_05500 [Christensenellales bacterium]